MIFRNAIISGRQQDIAFEKGKIIDIAETTDNSSVDLKGKRIIPGLVDIHSHGCYGYDTMDADFKPMCRFYGEHGTTSWFPTTMTMSYESLKKVTEAKTGFPGTNILGFHFEGPYICEKYKGGQNAKYIQKPSLESFSQFKNVKMITMAPEVDGAIEFIRNVSEDCVVSLGHTSCDYQMAVEAIYAGAKCLTHTFNAMPPLLHREPGPIGAAIDKNIYVQFICDGLHISRPVIIAAYRIFGPQKMVLISDSVRCAYLPDGDYDVGGSTVHLRNRQIRLDNGTISGSCATLWDCVKKAVEFGIPFDDAVRMATRTPAELMGVKKGKLEPGWDADLLIIDEDMEINTVIINGEVFWERES